MAPHQLLHTFISGLRHNIKSKVLAFRPIDLNDAIRLAYLQEQKLSGSAKPNSRTTSNYPGPKFSSHPNISSFSPTSSMLISSLSHGSLAFLPGVGRVPYKKLTSAEMQQKRKPNLCYHCDEEWHKNYRCSSTPKLFFYPKIMLWNTHLLNPTQPLRRLLLLLVLRRHQLRPLAISLCLAAYILLLFVSLVLSRDLQLKFFLTGQHS